MTNQLRATMKIRCNTCGCSLKRTKTIQVFATDKAAAKVEANEKVTGWAQSLKGQNCRICTSIIASV